MTVPVSPSRRSVPPIHSPPPHSRMYTDSSETDRFLVVSGVQVSSTNFHFHRTVFSSQIKSKVGNILVKVTGLRIVLNIDVTPIPSRPHTHPSHTQNSQKINLVSIFRCSSSPHNPVYPRHVVSDPSVLTFSLSLNGHPHICIPFRYCFIYCSQ